MSQEKVSFDHRIITRIVDAGAKVLDLGCGNGQLMLLLVKEKKAKVQGIELSEQAIYQCVEKGVSVFHSDIDSGLTEYPDNSFDYVILNESLQEVKKVEFVIQEALRVGKKVIVGFPNFAHIKARVALALCGNAPSTKSLPYHWYDTPNLRFLSISDFENYCATHKIRILQRFYLGKKRLISFFPNLFALNSLFILSKNGH
ncbi:MAG: methionine biosynthesis protein MetW [Candidatus Omnitrophica bacterium]|nr:methionine biosynthesis protein MetW [Candidatus Omnitrophota bacterium]